MRLFVALDIDDHIRGKITLFLDGVRGFAPEARWVRPESLHVTLKFIGEKSGQEVERIKSALAASAAEAIAMRIRGYGFFPSAQAPRMFWIGIEGGSPLTTLAVEVESQLAAIGTAKEEHDFSPHLTLARAAGGSSSPRWRKGGRPNHFHRLQEKLSALSAPEFGSMMASEFFLYQSQLAPGGSNYTKLAAFPLRAPRS